MSNADGRRPHRQGLPEKVSEKPAHLRLPDDVRVDDIPLSKLLVKHIEWLLASGQTTRRLVPEGTDLSLVDLEAANLQSADLSGVKLRGAWLRRCNLKGADLSGADFAGADLSEARLNGAKLNHANFRNTRLVLADLADLQGSMQPTETAGLRLGGADLTSTKLPERLERFELLESAKEASRSSMNILLSLVAALAYSALTIITTSDGKLIPDSATSPLPIIQTTVPIAAFFILAPVLLLGVFVYLHIHLDQLWRIAAKLPARFQDGATLDTKVHAGLFSTIVAGNLVHLQDEARRPLARCGAAVAYAVGWWATPAIILCLWWKYLARHDWLGTGIQVGVLLLAVIFAALSKWLLRATLYEETVAGGVIFASFRDTRAFASLSAIFVGFSALATVGISYGVIEKDLSRFPIFAANLTRQELTAWPEAWDGHNLGQIRGIDLSGKNLNHARASEAFLVKAVIRQARYADFQGADLREADLREAKLQGAKMRRAILAGAHLEEATLDDADLQAANLRGARLDGASLHKAKLYGADLSGAVLHGADLKGAEMRQANLSGANLKEVRNWDPLELKAAITDKTTILPDGSKGPFQLKP